MLCERLETRNDVEFTVATIAGMNMLIWFAGGAGVKMEHFQPALDPRKQELLEARFLGTRVSAWLC